jgi:acetyl esterase/lipase
MTTIRPQARDTSAPSLEPAAAAFAAATSAPPFLNELAPTEGRVAVDQAQSPEIEVPGTSVETIVIREDLTVDVFRPTGAATPLPVVLYTHGAGWVFGNSHTHGRLARELALGARPPSVFVNYSLSPGGPLPVALEQVHSPPRGWSATASSTGSTGRASPSPATRWAAT